LTVIAHALRRPALLSRPAAWSWGWLPALSLTAAAGLLCVAAGNRGAQAGAWWAELAFYGGLLLLVLPIGLRLILPGAEGTERVSLVALLALGLFLCKVVHDPNQVGAYDEFLHWRTAQDVMINGTVFTPNTLLGVSPYYPGLELVTTALSNIGGIPIFESGLIVLGAARLVFLVSLFFFFAMVSGSTRVAGIACLVYMTNPKFLYFDAQFSYESLALPLAALVLYLIARRGHSGPARWVGLTIIALVTLLAVVTTHHVTSGMLAGFLLLWAVIGLLIHRRDRSKPGRMGIVLLALIAGWTLLVATATIGYLAPALTASVGELFRLIVGDIDPRQLFVSRIGDVAPLWERLVGGASAGLIVVLLPVGLIIIWRRFRSSPVMIMLALAATLFPFTLAARLTSASADVAARTPEFLFVGIGVVVGLALAQLSFRGRLGMIQMAGVATVLAILTVGGVIVGLPGWARLPGPYLVSADGRSVESEGIAAAEWARDVLGAGNVMVADRVNSILMSTYGQQELVTTYETRLPLRRLYLVPDIGPVQRQIVRDGQIRYLVIDRRLSTGLPVVGHYYDRGERRLLGSQYVPLDPQLLAKWDSQPEVSRIFDSGNIQLYDVSALAQGT
jgi:hypothetical protein